MEVLVPFAVQPVSERAIRTALDLLGDDDRVRIIAVHATDRVDAPAEIAASELEAMGTERAASVEAEIHSVDNSSRDAVRELIEEIVERRDIDFIVLGYEERSLFEQLVESDTAERMLGSHGVPVLLVP